MSPPTKGGYNWLDVDSVSHLWLYLFYAVVVFTYTVTTDDTLFIIHVYKMFGVLNPGLDGEWQTDYTLSYVSVRVGTE